MAVSTFRHVPVIFFDISLIMELGEVAAAFCAVVTGVFSGFCFLSQCLLVLPTIRERKIISGSLNYLVNMTMDSNLIIATERTLLVPIR